MKKMNTSCKILALLTSAALFISSAAARIVTDETGHTAEVPDSLNRILITNIYPLPSVLTLYLNSADKIIGIHPSSMAAAQNGLLSEIYPDITKANTGFMKGNVLNIESVLKLKPDVVLVNAADKQSLSKLEAAGIPTVAFSTSAQKYDAVRTYKSWIKTLDELFPDHAKADKASKYAENVKALIEERTKSIAPQNRKKVLWIYQNQNNKVTTSGKNFFGQYWAEAVGAKNVSESIPAKTANAQVNMEQIYSWNPDVILITNFTPDTAENLIKNPLWAPISAVKNKEVYKLPLGFYRTYTPSADSPVLLYWLAKKIYPEQFKDIDLNNEARKYYREVFGIELTNEQLKKLFEPKPMKISTPTPGTA